MIALAVGSLWALWVIVIIKTPFFWGVVLMSSFFFLISYIAAMVVLWALYHKP